MSRTTRKPNKQCGFTSTRDGQPTRYSASCESHGGCPWCEKSREHKVEKRAPIYDESEV